MRGICKLCLKDSILRHSHIIPRSYYKNLKENGKLVMVHKGKHSTVGNFDPKEPMLCDDCEQYLSTTFENYGIRVLRDWSNVRKNSDHIIIKSFNYEKYYLYLLSILWRASISKHSHFQGVIGNESLDDALRHCISQNKLRFNKLSRLSIDKFIKICIYRIVDSSGAFNDDAIKGIVSNIGQSYDDTIDAVIWSFIADGFLIIYSISPGKDIYDMMTKKHKSELKKGSHQKIFKIEIKNSPILLTTFGNVVQALENSINHPS